MDEIQKPLKCNVLSESGDEWATQFVDVEEQELLFELILAANYMDIMSLLALLCAEVACMTKGRRVGYIRLRSHGHRVATVVVSESEETGHGVADSVSGREMSGQGVAISVSGREATGQGAVGSVLGSDMIGHGAATSVSGEEVIEHGVVVRLVSGREVTGHGMVV
ncbi:hypothetical protein PI124_g15799 [Phytophthora idaei]|nr:hypothetical protein PI125_g10048 [Phytophthora idaei]KAG3239269.1 hypothetical protein PI124_g15799 [Phytophthora idaei]